MVESLKKALKFFLAPLATALILTSNVSAVAQSCLSNPQIQQAVASGRILPLNELKQRAGIQGDSKVLQPVNVCANGNDLFYHLSILDKSGKAYKLVLHAVTGAS
jgi:hypothetical protein